MWAALRGPSSWVAFPDDRACTEASNAWQRAPTPFLHAGRPSPLLCPVRKSETSKEDIEYQTHLTALVEKVKTTVRCSRLWVLPSGAPRALGEGRVGSLPPPPPPPKALGQAAQAPFE